MCLMDEAGAGCPQCPHVFGPFLVLEQREEILWPFFLAPEA